MSRKLENGLTVDPDNVAPMSPQSTQEDVASLRESLTADIQAIAAELPQIDIRVNPAVEENGTQRFEKRNKRNGETAVGRALFVLSFNSPWSAGRTVIEGNSSEIRSALSPFLSDPALAARVKAARLASLMVKLGHAKAVVIKLQAEVNAIS